MINMTLSSIKNSTNFFDIDDAPTMFNGRKKKKVEKFSLELEKK